LNFFTANGLVKNRSTHEITAKSSSCSLKLSGDKEINTIISAPIPNHTVVSAIVKDSMKIQITITASQNHGRCDKIISLI
jgi:hypothetical protein